MTTEKLMQLIERKNEDNENELSKKAERIIEEIAQRQQTKIALDNEIFELRDCLKTLQAAKLDSKSILGDL